MYTSTWLPFYAPKPSARTRLVFIPPVTFRAALFQSWQRLLPPEIAMCAVELPGRGTRARERPIVDRAAFVDDLAREVLPLCNGPLAIAGWCSGSVLAHALAQHLQTKYDVVPSRLFVGTCVSPSLDIAAERLTSHGDVAAWARSITGQPLPELDDPEFLALYGALILAEQSLYLACRSVREPRVTCPITAFAAARDSSVSEEQVGAWRDCTSGSFRFERIDGSHMMFMEEAPRDALLRAIAGDLLA